jgi:multiple sugar transport system ATP-binding protein
MRSEIKRFHQQTKITTIYVTHDQLEAITLADRIVVMHDGQIEQVGTPMEVYENPRSVFVATFIGSPGMNLFPGVLEKQGDQMLLNLEGFTSKMVLPPSKAQLGVDGQKVILGIRPSDVFWANKAPEFKNPQEIDPSWYAQGVVELVELLGKNAYVTFKVGGHDGLSEIIGRQVPAYKEEIKLGLNLHYAHLFNAENQLNLQIPAKN